MAVRAAMGGHPDPEPRMSETASEILRYSGLKLWPHWDTQWASSTTTRLTSTSPMAWRKPVFQSRSGETYSSR